MRMIPVVLVRGKSKKATSHIENKLTERVKNELKL